VTVGWRLLKKKHQATAFDGEGARLAGGRWNLPGTRAVYLSDSLALAALEIFVHLQRAAVALAFVAFRVEIPDALVTTVAPVDLPKGWRAGPPPESTQRAGSRFLAAGTSPVLRLPSVLIPAEHNFLVSPAHPDFGRLRISKPAPFSFDPRMWK